jgi:predicted N-acetyltransferase YhbS
MTTFANFGAPDYGAVDQLLDRCFGPARHARTAYRLRDGVSAISEFSLVANDADGLAGAVQLWPVQLREAGGRKHALILLGPLVVAPDRRCAGLGSRLVDEALARVDAAGGAPVVLIGDAPYYGRFGFTAEGTAGWNLPGPVDRARLLVRGGAGLPSAAWLETVRERVTLAA